MSFLLLSGALLTPAPVYRIEPECYYAIEHKLMQTIKADNFRTHFGILGPMDAAVCHVESVGIELTMPEDYLAAFQHRAHLLEPQLPLFDYRLLLIEKTAADEADTAPGSEAQPVTDDDYALYANDGEAGSSVFSALNATIPTASAPPPVWKPLLRQQAQPASFIFPLTTALYVTSSYGLRYHPVIHSFMRHEGTDFRAALNSEVMSIADGVIVETGYGPVTGFFVTVRHQDGWSSRYLHLNQLSVSRHQIVQQGNVIGLSGNTGRSNGPHLHLEISHNERLLDPMTLLFEPRQKTTQAAAVVPASAPAVSTPDDMIPAIAIVMGEGSSLQIGVRTGHKMTMYSPDEPVETDRGTWRITKKFGKYRLVKIETPDDI